MCSVNIFISGIPVSIAETDRGWSVMVGGIHWGYFSSSSLAATAALAIVNCELGNFQVA